MIEFVTEIHEIVDRLNLNRIKKLIMMKIKR